jgi:hypothetical protein
LTSRYTTHVIRGTLNWAKVLGAPQFNEYAKEKQWSVDVSPDDKGLAELKRLKLSTGEKSKLKNKKDGRGDFISFRQSEFKKNGEPNDPIKITDAQGNPWPANKLIGNGSKADVKFSYCDFGATKGSYIKAIRVLEHVPYVVQEFAPLSEDDEFFAGTDEPQASSDGAAPVESEAQDEDLDDDVPF